MSHLLSRRLPSLRRITTLSAMTSPIATTTTAATATATAMAAMPATNPPDDTNTAALKRVPIPPRGVDYRGKVVLAPMVRSGELPSRLLALHYGADLVWGPETVDRALIGTTRRVNAEAGTIDWTRKPAPGTKPAAMAHHEGVIYRLHPELERGRLIFQIGTSNPDLAVAAARLVAADVAGIDVNAGCPKPFSTHDGMGAALLRTPDRLVAILEALVRDVAPEFGIGISVKIRLLETADETEALVRRLVATGITGLTVHCRTTPMRPRERAIRGQLRMVASVCREAGVACLMNGDVEGRDQARQLAGEYGADGAMIATAAEANPSVFLPGGPQAVRPWEEVVERYVRTAMDVRNKYGNTKFLLAQLVPGKSPMHMRMNQCKSYTQICRLFGWGGDGGEDLVERARAVDVAIGIDPEKDTKKSFGSSNKKSGKGKGKAAKGSGTSKGADNPSAQAAGGNTVKPPGPKNLSQRGVTAGQARDDAGQEPQPEPAAAAAAIPA